jgi:hypothetical protein
MKMKQEDRATLRRERATYQENRRNRNEVQELRTQVLQELGDTVVTQSQPLTDIISVSQRSQMSQLSTTSNSIMGGRNEQVQNRQSRRAAAVTTQRLIRSTTPQDAKLWSEPPTNTVSDNECDTNDDMCCLGKNFIVLNATYCTADVYAYDASIKPIKNNNKNYDCHCSDSIR